MLFITRPMCFLLERNRGVSTYIVINEWTGTNESIAIQRMAKLFRMSLDKADAIFDRILSGQSWQFEKTVSDQQGEKAVSFLGDMGFRVDLKPPDSNGGAPAVPKLPSQTQTLPRAATQSVASSRGKYQFGFSGTGGELFRIFIVNLILTVLTLGVYRFWAKTKLRHYLYENTSFANDRFAYHGTAMELLNGFFRFTIIFTLISVGISGLELMAPKEGQIARSFVSLLIFLFLPYFMVSAWRYRLSRTSWRGIRFSFRGKVKEATWIYVKGWILSILTLNFYNPWFYINQQTFWRSQSHFGNLNMEFDGKGRDIFKRFLLNALLLIPTLGFCFFWYLAYLQRYSWEHTSFQGQRFKFTATGGQLMSLHVGNFFLFILTLGLAYPWILVRNNRFLATHLTLQGTMSLDKVVQDMKNSGTFGEAALDSFDVPVDVF